jgi:hypothetical protein
MSSKVVKEVTVIERWDARVMLLDGKDEMFEIFLSGILAPTKAEASNLVWAKSLEYFKELDPTVNGAGVRIIALEPEDSKAPPDNGVRPYHAAPRTPVVHTPYVPFSCPLIDLCDTKFYGVGLGTQLVIEEWKDEEEG